MSAHSLPVRLVLAACLVLFVGCHVPVVHNLPEGEANRIVAVLQRHGIVARKLVVDPDANTWSVEVPRDATARAWSVLAEYKLPRTPDRRFQDVFGRSKLVVTPVEERALYLEALQGEIAGTLETIAGVIDARVHLVLPEKDLSGQPRSTPKASVVLEYQPSAQGVAPIQPVEVQELVAHAVDGLAGEAVSVILKPSSIAAPSSQAGAFDMVSSAGLVLERGSVARFKMYVGAATLALLVLGALFFLNGRQMARLQEELVGTRAQVRALQRSGTGAPRSS